MSMTRCDQPSHCHWSITAAVAGNRHTFGDRRVPSTGPPDISSRLIRSRLVRGIKNDLNEIRGLRERR
jgi:hypothetical protein